MMNCMELRKVLRDCFDEWRKILVSRDEEEFGQCVMPDD